MNGAKFSERTEAFEPSDATTESCLLDELLDKDSARCLNSTESTRTTNGRLKDTPGDFVITGQEDGPASEQPGQSEQLQLECDLRIRNTI